MPPLGRHPEPITGGSIWPPVEATASTPPAKSGLVAAGLHQRNGKGARAHHVGYGGAVNGAHQSGGHHCREGRAALDFSGQGDSDVIDEIGTAGGFQNAPNITNMKMTVADTLIVVPNKPSRSVARKEQIRSSE